MTTNRNRRLVVFLVAILIGALGGWVVRNWTHSDAQLQADSARQISEYVPICDGKEMGPRDVCLVIGGHAEGGSYSEMVDRHTASVSPQKLAQRDRNFRVFGYVLLVVAVLLLVPVLTVSWAAVRSGPARRAIAARHGWTYQREDALLASRAWSVVVDPGSTRATDIVAGTHNGIPFTVYTYLTKEDRARTAYLATLPVEVPRMVVLSHAPGRIAASTSPEGRQLLIAKLGVVPGDTKYGTFAAEGRSVMRAGPLRGSGKGVLRGIDDVVTLAAQITAAVSDTKGAGDAERVAAFLKGSGRTVPALYRGRVAGAAFGLLAAAGGAWLLTAGHPVMGSLVALVGALTLLGNVLGLVSVRRTRAGRPRFALAHGWAFKDEDPTLVERLNLPTVRQYRPAAGAIIAGIHAGLPFMIFDCLTSNGTKDTVYAVQLPSPVPMIRVQGGSANRASNGTSAEGAALLTAGVWQELNGHFTHALTARGTWIVALNPGFLSPRAARMEQFLDGLTRVGKVLSGVASGQRTR